MVSLCYSPYIELRINPKDEIYNYARTYRIPKKQCERYADIIVQWSFAYNLDPLLVSRIVAVESSFRWWVHSRIDGKRFGFGPMQVSKYWYHILYRVDNGKLGKKLLEGNGKNLWKYLCRIGYGIEAGCIVLRWYIDYCNGNIPLSLIAYNHGHNSKVFSKAKEKGMRYIKTLDYYNKVNGMAL